MWREEGAEEVTRNQEERLRGQCRETAEEDRDRQLNHNCRNGSVDKALAV